MAPHREISSTQVFDVDDEKLGGRKVDAALQYLRAEEGEVFDIDEKKLLRKIDLLVMPLMFGAYLRFATVSPLLIVVIC